MKYCEEVSYKQMQQQYYVRIYAIVLLSTHFKPH